VNLYACVFRGFAVPPKNSLYHTESKEENMVRVLVIDDDAGVRESFRAALEAAGHRVTTVDSGLAGLESVRASVPDLVFLDLKMPGLSGVDTLSALHAEQPSVPVYVVTAFYGNYLASLRVLEGRGVDFNLARKPLTVREIQAIAAGRLGELKRHRESPGTDAREL
jgi:CheY-like chemotaxis protein